VSWNAGQPIDRSSQHTGDGAGGVGITAAIDHVDQAILEAVGVEEGLKHRL